MEAISVFEMSLRLLLAIGSLAAIPAFAGEAGHCAAPTAMDNWPQWRGPLANGMSPKAKPPIQWSETNSIRWKIELPAKGHSSPIVFGDSIYLLGATPVGEAQKAVYDDAPG